jgi:hypothetical protein
LDRDVAAVEVWLKSTRSSRLKYVKIYGRDVCSLRLAACVRKQLKISTAAGSIGVRAVSRARVSFAKLDSGTVLCGSVARFRSPNGDWGNGHEGVNEYSFQNGVRDTES